jgi:hypothetical protein
VPHPSANRTLYDLGRDYVERVDRRVADGMPERNAIPAVARHVGRGVAEVRTANAFARAVQTIASAAGPKARAAVLAGTNPHLTPKLVTRLAGLPADRLLAAMGRAALDHPSPRIMFVHH